MKRSEIHVGKRYAAKVHFVEPVIVDVLEVGCERSIGIGYRKRRDGVRVRVVQPYSRWGRDVPAGAEEVVATRDIQYEWTNMHQERRDAAEAEARRNQVRARAVEDALVARGVAARVDGKSTTVRLTLDQAEKLLGLEGGE